MPSKFENTVYGPLPAGLKCAPLGSLCERDGVQTGPFGSQLHKDDYVAEGTPIITVEHLSENRIAHSNLPMVSEADRERLAKYSLRTGDIVFSRVGSVDRRALVQPSENGWLFSGRCLRVRPQAGVLDSAWLSYFFGLPAFKSYIRGIAVGATMPSINTKILSDVPIYYPPIEVQVQAAEVLASLDNRIDLLRQTNTTLESIAQALFKSWFIDFDPVRAKAEGREPECMDAATAALFPAEFQESALGLIPKRWQPATLADAMHLNPARSLSKGISAPYLEMANAPTTGHRPLELVAQRAFGSGCKFTNGDALLAKITPCLENGKSAFVDFLAEDQVGWGSTEFIVMRSKPVLPDYCAYLLARYEPFRQFAIQSMTGTSGRQRVELSRLAQFPMALPPDSTIASAVAPMFCALQSRIAANDEVAQSLSSLRDTLLPRLISGKLRLPEAQEQLEDALV